ncbi:MAG: coproporphyrinogen dehydrogenase HemZ [Ruminococcus sp.]|nr:coproporphyrinogen dehydrogenase HemZ [Ruminococcus sp.]
MSERTKPQSFPVFLHGHGLKYEIECILKAFVPAVRFQFYYDDLSLLKESVRFAAIQLRPGRACTYFYCAVSLGGKTLRLAQRTEKLYPQENKQQCETIICKMLFRLLQELTGLDVPWGILTGIRPVRKVLPLMEEGLTQEQIYDTLRRKYWISDEKLNLVYETARVQRPLLQQTPKNSIGLYVSIPFCPTRCSYCSFVSHSVEQAKKLMPEYIRLLCKELEIWGRMVRELGLIVDTVYFGGGTPTSVSAEYLEQLMQAVEKNFDLSHIREYCVEAGRPDTITADKLAVLRKYGVDRISINPQTMNDEVLKTIGRRHTAEEIVESFRLARSFGFENINMDLIAGLPSDTPESFHRTLEQVLALDPDSITVHTLTLKRAANLFAEGASQLDNPVREMVRDSIAMLPENGYLPYYMYRQKNTIDNQENVGYAKPGKESYYNMLIMDETQSIFGAGCAASTKLVEPNGMITRVCNYKFPYEYIAQFDQLMEKKQQVYEVYNRIREQEAANAEE